MSKKVTKEKHVIKEYAPWVEKYRPKQIDDIAHQTHVVQALRHSLESNNLPHLLFHGPPGTGKTSTILALARQLFGPDLMRDRVLELNASDERGINVVREKVKQFAQYAVNDTPNDSKQNSYPCPPFKIVILDEADNMTRDAQNALRRTMEKYSTVTRFCLICNYVSKIIAPVASRCAKFRFHSLTTESMKGKLEEIARNEDVKIEEAAMNEIIEIANGDMRKSITLMQGAALMKPNDEIVRSKDVNAVAVRVPKSIIFNNIVEAISSNSFDKVNNVCSFIISEGYPVPLVLSELLELVISTDLSTIAKSELCIKLAESDKKLVDGASEQLQLLDVLASIAKAFSTSKKVV